MRTAGSEDVKCKSPCAACKVLRRRCGDDCILAPYFPPANISEFTLVHGLYGTSNLIRILKEVPKESREDAVNSLVYEAWARARDPVYGCAGIVSRMQSQITDLQSQMVYAQVELAKFRHEYQSLADRCHQLLSMNDSLGCAITVPTLSSCSENRNRES